MLLLGENFRLRGFFFSPSFKYAAEGISGFFVSDEKSALLLSSVPQLYLMCPFPPCLVALKILFSIPDFKLFDYDMDWLVCVS